MIRIPFLKLIFSFFLITFISARKVIAQTLKQTSAISAESVTSAVLKCANNESYPVHLTFDDGPKIPETEIILDILKKNNIKATFLVSTLHFPKLLKGQTSEHETRLLNLLQRMKNEGHTVGNHSYEHISHTSLKKQTEEQIFENLKINSLIVAKLNLKKPIPFRFPYGSGWFQEIEMDNQMRADKVMKFVKAEGYEPTHWDIDSWDWSKIKRKALPQSMLYQICSHQGGLVLMHDIHSFTANNLQALIDSITNSGHKIVSLPEIKSINLKKRSDDKYTSFADKAAGLFLCGRPVSDYDNVWPSCEVYLKKSSDFNDNLHRGQK